MSKILFVLEFIGKVIPIIKDIHKALTGNKTIQVVRDEKKEVKRKMKQLKKHFKEKNDEKIK